MTILHVAQVQHRHGINSYVSLTEDGLYEELAEFVREWEHESRRFEYDESLTHQENVEWYFECQEGSEWLTVDTTELHIPAKPEPDDPLGELHQYLVEQLAEAAAEGDFDPDLGSKRAAQMAVKLCWDNIMVENAIKDEAFQKGVATGKLVPIHDASEEGKFMRLDGYGCTFVGHGVTWAMSVYGTQAAMRAYEKLQGPPMPKLYPVIMYVDKAVELE